LKTAPHFVKSSSSLRQGDRGLCTTLILNNGLEEIGEQAFRGCIVCIDIPPAVILNDRLEEIGEWAFSVDARLNTS
jgi:hypothetical protein